VLYRRALLGTLAARATDQLPLTELLVRGVEIDRSRLTRYAKVCGFRLGDTLPPTYPHVIAFPLTLDLMTRPEFPFPPTGAVHIDNVIDAARDIAAQETLDLTVRAENLRDHERGRAVDLVTVISAGGSQVWRERSTYLRRDGAPRRSD